MLVGDWRVGPPCSSSFSSSDRFFLLSPAWSVRPLIRLTRARDGLVFFFCFASGLGSSSPEWFLPLLQQPFRSLLSSKHRGRHLIPPVLYLLGRRDFLRSVASLRFTFRTLPPALMYTLGPPPTLPTPVFVPGSFLPEVSTATTPILRSSDAWSHGCLPAIGTTPLRYYPSPSDLAWFFGSRFLLFLCSTASLCVVFPCPSFPAHPRDLTLASP